jgi:hypothetical protein
MSTTFFNASSCVPSPLFTKNALPMFTRQTKKPHKLFVCKAHPFCFVTRIGFKPMTYCLEGSCSIQLSYRAIFKLGGKDIVSKAIGEKMRGLFIIQKACSPESNSRYSRLFASIRI